jgi:hypothetical protein
MDTKSDLRPMGIRMLFNEHEPIGAAVSNLFGWS